MYLQVQALKALSLLTPFNGALVRASSQNIPKVPSLLFDIEVSSRGMNDEDALSDMHAAAMWQLTHTQRTRTFLSPAAPACCSWRMARRASPTRQISFLRQESFSSSSLCCTPGALRRLT